MLAGVPLFAGLKGKQIKSVASAFARERSYDAGEVIEKEGGSAVAFYLITGGAGGGREGGKLVLKMGGGQVFGGVGLIHQEARAGTVGFPGSGTKSCVRAAWDIT